GHDELVGIGALGGLDDPVAAGAGVAVGNVPGDSVLEQERFLGNDADLSAEAADAQVADVVAVDRDRPLVHVPESGQQVHERGLAAAVGADQGDGLAVVDLERDALEQGRAAGIAEVDVPELDDLGLSRQVDRRGTFNHPGLAIHHGADAVGRRRGALDLGMNIRKLADRVGRTGEHGVQCEQLLDGHDLGCELDLERAELEKDGLLEHQIRASQKRDGHRHQGEHFQDRVGHGVDHRHPDRLAVEVLGLDEESPALDAFHGEGLDHLDPLEAFLKDLVDRRHAFQRAPHGALHDPADAQGGQRRDRHDHKSEAGQSPVQVERTTQAHGDPHRLANQLAEQGDQTLTEEAAQVQVDCAAEEQVADVELRPLHDVRDQDFLEEHEEALGGHAQDDQANEQQQIAKGIGGQISVNKRFETLVPGQPPLFAFLVFLNLHLAIANRGEIAGLQPGAAAAQLGEAALHDIELLLLDFDLGQLFLDQLRPEALQIGQVDALLGVLQLLPDRVRLDVESLVVLG